MKRNQLLKSSGGIADGLCPIDSRYRLKAPVISAMDFLVASSKLPGSPKPSGFVMKRLRTSDFAISESLRFISRTIPSTSIKMSLSLRSLVFTAFPCFRGTLQRHSSKSFQNSSKALFSLTSSSLCSPSLLLTSSQTFLRPSLFKISAWKWDSGLCNRSFGMFQSRGMTALPPITLAKAPASKWIHGAWRLLSVRTRIPNEPFSRLVEISDNHRDPTRMSSLDIHGSRQSEGREAFPRLNCYPKNFQMNIIGKTIAKVTKLRNPSFDDARWLKLDFTDGTYCVVTARCGDYTDHSEQEYQLFIEITEDAEGLIPSSDNIAGSRPSKKFSSRQQSPCSPLPTN